MNLYVFELEEKSPGWFVTMTIDFESVALTPFESRVSRDLARRSMRWS